MNRKQQSCPSCGAPLKRIPIIYGLPTAEFAEQVARGEVEAVTAGCLIEPGAPKYACATCREPIAVAAPLVSG